MDYFSEGNKLYNNQGEIAFVKWEEEKKAL